MTDIDTVLGWRGRTVRDRAGEKVGSLGAIYLDRETDRPAYAGVRTGLLGRSEHVVPLDGAEEVDGDVRVPYAKDRIEAAPDVDPEVALSEAQEDLLAEHYEAPTRTEGDATEMVRSEEEVEIGVQPSARRERVRLRKYMVTEEVEQTVPVRREEIRLEHEPPPEGRIVDVEDAGDDPAR